MKQEHNETTTMPNRRKTLGVKKEALGPFFQYEKKLYTYACSLVILVAAIFVVLPDSWFLTDASKDFVVKVAQWWPKIGLDAAVVAKVNPARAIQLIILMLIATGIGSTYLILAFGKLITTDLTGPHPYYVRRFNLLNSLFLIPLFWWVAYFGKSFAQFDSTVRGGRGIFYSDFCLFLYALASIFCFVGIIRAIATYWVLLFKKSEM